MNMGERIKQLRLQKGITQEELGRVIGVKKAAIMKYENGSVTNMKRKSIQKMAAYFGVSPSYLMGFEDNINNGVNNGIIGNNNNNNIINGVELDEIEAELLTLCSQMTVTQKARLLTYANDLLDK